jgi:hypothetical protein
MQCRQESELKIQLKNWEMINVNNTNFLGVIIDCNLSWEVHIETTCSRISHNKTNGLSKVLDMIVRRMLHYI